MRFNTMSSSFLPSSVSSSSFGPIGPLTTIFTPPADCFTATPSVWETCGVSYGTARCYWSQPDSCYPSGAQITSSIIWGLGTTLYPAVYAYSPGVLPSGYVTSGGLVDNTLIDSVSGCYAYVSPFTTLSHFIEHYVEAGHLYITVRQWPPACGCRTRALTVEGSPQSCPKSWFRGLRPIS